MQTFTEPEGFGYCWQHCSGMFYYGIHKGSIFGSYAGSGTAFKKMFGGKLITQCYDISKWNRAITFRGNYVDCVKWEEDTVTEILLQNKYCLNLTTGGATGFTSNETKKLISKKSKQMWQNPALRNKLTNSMSAAKLKKIASGDVQHLDAVKARISSGINAAACSKRMKELNADVTFREQSKARLSIPKTCVCGKTINWAPGYARHIKVCPKAKESK